MEDSVVAVTDVMHSCRCCLRCAPDRDLTTPYTHLGTAEIYSDMLRECFDLQLEVGSDGSCGICSACVGRLRDARDFKLQVQRSQADLQARLQGDLISEDVKLEVKSEDDEDEICFVLYEDPVVKLEVDNNELGEVVLQDPLFESKPADDVTKDEDLSASEKKRYSCNQCTRSFTQKAKLKIHQKQHTGVKDHICEVCGAGFYHQKSLVRHNLIHKGERPFACTLCNKNFIARCDLNRHLRIHSGYKPFKCATCTMSFNAKHQLQNHERMHTGERPYTCEVCNVCFSYKVNLNNHVYKVHGINLKFKSIHVVTEEVLRRELGLAGAIAHVRVTKEIKPV